MATGSPGDSTIPPLTYESGFWSTRTSMETPDVDVGFLTAVTVPVRPNFFPRVGSINVQRNFVPTTAAVGGQLMFWGGGALGRLLWSALVTTWFKFAIFGAPVVLAPGVLGVLGVPGVLAAVLLLLLDPHPAATKATPTTSTAEYEPSRFIYRLLCL